MKSKTILTTLVISAIAYSTVGAFNIPQNSNPGSVPNAPVASNSDFNDVHAGYGAYATGRENTINADATSSLVTGYQNTVNGRNSFTFGVQNKANGENSFVGGNNSKTTGRDTFAFGANAEAVTEYTYAIGSQAKTAAYNTVAIGNGAYVSGESSVVLGRTNNVTGENTVVVGANNNTVAGGQSAVVGYNNKIGNQKEQLVFGSNSESNGQGALVFGTHAKSLATDAVAFGNNTVADVHNSVALGTNSTTDTVVSTASAVIAGKTYNFAGDVADSTVSVGTTGKAGAGGVMNYKRTITNVAAGRISDTSTDAINGSQLHATIKAIDKNHQDIADTAKGLQMLGDVINDHETAIAANKQAAADAMAEAKKHTIVTAGDNIEVTEDAGTYTVSTTKDLNNLNSVNLTDENNESHYTVEGVNMVHRGDGSENEYHTNYKYDGIHISTVDGSGTPVNNISLTDKGLNNGGNTIINIARGVNDTDAVNMSQLNATNNALNGVKQNVAANTADIRTIEHTVGNHEGRITVLEKDTKDIKSQVSDLNNRITDVGRNTLNQANHYTDLQVNKGVAKASALAGLQFLDYNPKDKWSFAASVGHYRNANAVAVGAAYQPNENTMVHGGITVDGKIAYNLGVSFKTGGQKYVNKYDLQDQVKQLQSDNAELRQELAELRSMIEKK